MNYVETNNSTSGSLQLERKRNQNRVQLKFRLLNLSLEYIRENCEDADFKLIFYEGNLRIKLDEKYASG